MILSFQGHDRDKFIKETNEMFQLRARAFSERMGWRVSVTDGWEIDEYDNLDPLYLLSHRNGRVNGCLRLLPTTGPTLLSGSLGSLFDHSVDIRSPLIFEGTRFAVEDDEVLVPRGVSKATVELLMAACETMLEAGVSHMVGVIEQSTFRVCGRAGWKPAIIARSTQAKGILAVLWEVNKSSLDRMVQMHGFRCDRTDADAAWRSIAS
jgi:acyl homoserine lactone synthase